MSCSPRQWEILVWSSIYHFIWRTTYKFNQCPSSLSFTKYLIYIWSASWQDNVVYIVFCQFKAVHSTLRFSMNFQLLVRPVYIAVLTTQKSCLAVILLPLWPTPRIAFWDIEALPVWLDIEICSCKPPACASYQTRHIFRSRILFLSLSCHTVANNMIGVRGVLQTYIKSKSFLSVSTKLSFVLYCSRTFQ